MSATPKTIQIFLPGGDPRGIRVAEITTRIVQVFEVPRSLLQTFLEMPESAQVAVYFLIGRDEETAEQRVYIGQTGDLCARLTKHNKDKDFWERALVLISRTNSLTQTHALFLESHCLQSAKAADRYVAENGNGGTKPYTPPPLEADCMEIFETGNTLLATLGHPIFEPVAYAAPETQNKETLFCKGSGADGRGIYTPEGFVVLKGSTGRKELVPSAKGRWVERVRSKLLQSGILRENGETIIFEKDHLFNSPSGACVALMGRHGNGWVEWRNKDGKSLAEITGPNP